MIYLVCPGTDLRRKCSVRFMDTHAIECQRRSAGLTSGHARLVSLAATNGA